MKIHINRMKMKILMDEDEDINRMKMKILIG